MPMFREPFKTLEGKFKDLENGKVVNYSSESEKKVNQVKSFYDVKYHILGPTFMEEDKKYVITFVYDKNKVGENQNA